MPIVPVRGVMRSLQMFLAKRSSVTTIPFRCSAAAIQEASPVPRLRSSARYVSCSDGMSDVFEKLALSICSKWVNPE